MHLRSRNCNAAAQRLAVIGLLSLAACPVRAQYTAGTLPLPSGVYTAKASAANGGQQVGTLSIGYGHAALWNNEAGSPIDLDPGPGWYGSLATGVYGGYQGGAYGASSYISGGSGRGGGGSHRVIVYHAALWHGSAASMIDLNPPGYKSSMVTGISSGKQVGEGVDAAGAAHALLWSGKAANPVNLDAPGYYGSSVTAIDANKQVGYATASSGYVHALLWSGTAASAVDLNPTAFATWATYAYAVDAKANQQVGLVTLASTFQNHAILWNGTAASAIDLNPSGFYTSQANAVRGGYQVGFGENTQYETHALLWHGTAAGAVDLHTFLPSNFITSSAYGIDSDGSIVGRASDGSYTYAVIWKLNSVPEIVVTQDVQPLAVGWSNQPVTLTFNSPYTTTGASITYRINGGVATTAAGEVTTLPLNTTGSFIVQSYALDGAGHKTIAQYYTANVDLAPPVTTLTYSSNILTLTATDLGSGVYATYYILDGVSATYFKPIVLQNVPHTLEYWSVDKAANVETHHTTQIPAVAPTLASLSPNIVLSGSPDITLTLTGSGFLSNSGVQWNGAALTTTYVSASQLQATVPAADLASASTAQVTVTNPSPGTGTSNALTFTIAQKCIASGGAANIGYSTFDISPVTSNSGFTLQGNTVHVVTTSSTTYYDSNGSPISASTFFGNLEAEDPVQVTGTFDSKSNTITAWQVQLFVPIGG